MIVSFIVLLTCAIAVEGRSEQSPIPTDQARSYFDEAKRECEIAGARLWGKSLCGPMMFVDPATRTFVASERPRVGVSSEESGVFVGKLPVSENIANTAFSWGGTKWTQIMWPLPPSAADRAVLMAHELFHRIQSDLRFPSSNPSNRHLDTVDGRYLLQLEWRALAAALKAKDARARQTAIDDAIAFRRARRQIFPSAAAEEKALEVLEGLAEYTGVATAFPAVPERIGYALQDIERQNSVPTFVRSFAYASGPAYGLLLDQAGASWRPEIPRGADLGDLLSDATKVELPADTRASVPGRAARYDGVALRSAEQERWGRKQSLISEYRKRFIEGPTLKVALRNMKVQFDPRTLEPLGDAGTVYPTMRIVDDWGVLNVTGGALLSADWKTVTVIAPENGATRGKGWELHLNDGWKIAPDGRGSYTLVRNAGL